MTPVAVRYLHRIVVTLNKSKQGDKPSYKSGQRLAEDASPGLGQSG